MAENEAAVEENQQENKTEETAAETPYQITIEDAGPATKKISIEIPAEVISSKVAEQYQTLRKEAAIPGFRPGHAPAKLIEKRFHNDVRDQVRRSIISESYEEAVKKHSLAVIGEPQFDGPTDVPLPETGNFTYTFQVEVQPDITLPNLTGLNIKKPKADVTEDHIDQAMKNLREQQGALVPVEDRGVEAGDYLLADVHLKVDGEVVSHQHDAQLVARAGRVGGIQIDDLAEKVAGMKTGEKREFTVKAPDTHADEKLRGKDAVVEIALKEIKKLEPVEITPEFLQSLGFETEAELRDALREQMHERVRYDVQQSMRSQVNDYLLQTVHMDLPSKMSERQAARLVQRRAMDQLMRGVPEDQVRASIGDLQGDAKDAAAKELKLFFILQKVAAEQNVDVSEGELNNRIAIIAAQSARRPEKVKQEMSGNGSLMQLYIQMREQKALDKILESAQITEVMPDAPAQA